MKYRTTALSLVFLVCAAAAEAQLQRTFVSASGNDANNCSRTAPCRNFAAAIAATLPAGEVVALDSAGYGPVTITQPVAIISPPGVYAGITAFSGNAILVNAPSAVVVLRGLTLNSQGASDGVYVQQASAVHVDNCIMTGFSQAGVAFVGSGSLFVDDSAAIGNGSGLVVSPVTGSVTGSVNRSRFERNYTEAGVLVTSTSPGTKMTVRDCLFSYNQVGVAASNTTVDVYNCVANHGIYAYYVEIGGTLIVSGSAASDNTAGFVNNAATFYSFGNNAVTANTNNISGSGITTLLMH